MPASKTNDMTTGQPLKTVLMFALPLLIGSIFQQIYNLVDTMIAGNYLGKSAIAAIGATSVIYSLLISFTGGLNNGYCIVLSNYFGANDGKGFRQGVAAMVMLNVIIGIILTVIPLIFLKPLMRVLETPDDIFNDAYTYIVIIIAGTLTTIGYNMCAGFMRALGNSKTPLYFLMISSVLNLILDVLLVILIPMGIAGAAAATVIAQGISAALSISYIVKKYRNELPERESIIPSGKIVGEMMTAGLSMGMMNSVFSIGSVIMQKAINALGTDIITAHTASRRFFELLMIPMATLANANSTFVGQNYGAGRLDRIRESNRNMILTEFAWAGISFAVTLTLGKFFVRLLTGTDNADIIDNAMMNLYASVVLFCPLGILFVTRTAMQAMGHKILPVLSSGIELAVKVVSAIWIVPAKGYFAVVFTEPSTWMLCAVFLGIFYTNPLNFDR
ncbi:MAG: MATE family efflux transporter [Alistipes sp.]|nr:MATE family efflux transporter [Alistipes sp.]